MTNDKRMRTTQIQRFLKPILSLVLVLFCCWQVWAQAPFYRVGDVYTNTDGSKGIIFYIKPDGGGWMVALNDLQSESWKSRLEPYIDVLTPITSPNQFGMQDDGYANTDTLRRFLTLGSAAHTVDFDNGWYLPSAEQLSILFASLSRIYPLFIQNGGFAPGSRIDKHYWSSTPYDRSRAWRMNFSNGIQSPADKSQTSAIRAIRNFTCEYPVLLDSSISFLWSTNDTTFSIEVSPDTTTEYYVVATNSEGDKDTAYFTLQVHPFEEVYDTVLACDSYGEYVDVGEYDYDDTAHTGYGCPFVTHWHVKIFPSYDITIEETICTGDFPYTWRDTVFQEGTVSGEYVFHRNIVHIIGSKTVVCDSVVTLRLTVNPNYDTVITETICSEELLAGWTWRDTVFHTGTESGEYVFHKTSIHGCDSIVVLQLHVFSGNITEQTAAACGFYTINDTTIFDSGEYLIHFDIGAGCDSVVRLYLTIYPEQHDTTIVTECDEYFWRGNVYTETGEYESFETNQSGCDSVHHLKLFIKKSGIKDYYGEVCKGEDYIDTENDFMISRTDTMALGCNDISFYRGFSASGCDSIHILHLSVYGREIEIKTLRDTICTNETDSVKLEVVGDNYTDIPTSCSIPEITIGDILCTDGSIVKPNLDSLNGHTAKGVVFHVDASGMHGWAVELQMGHKQWSQRNILADTNRTCNTIRKALRDTSGYAHTRAMLNVQSQNFYQVLDGMDDTSTGWYLPAVGQLRELFANIIMVKQSLSFLNELVSPEVVVIEINNVEYWSSTEYNKTKAYTVNMLHGKINMGNQKTNYNKRRFVCSF